MSVDCHITFVIFSNTFRFFNFRQACEIDEVSFCTAYIDPDLRHDPVDEECIVKLSQAASDMLRKSNKRALNNYIRSVQLYLF